MAERMENRIFVGAAKGENIPKCAKNAQASFDGLPGHWKSCPNLRDEVNLAVGDGMGFFGYGVVAYADGDGKFMAFRKPEIAAISFALGALNRSLGRPTMTLPNPRLCAAMARFSTAIPQSI